MSARYDRLGFYHDSADRRLFVPKKIPAFGWTVNLGHPRGKAVAGALIGGWLLLAAISIAAARRPSKPKRG
jgi:uncharacterized membrane protein